MNKILLAISLLFTSLIQAQLTVNNTTQTPAQLVQNVLIGGGVTPTNIKFNGFLPSANVVRDQVGEFITGSTPTNLGLSRGLIIATGDAQYALGPNDCAALGCGSIPSITANGSDPDLALLSGQTIFNSAVLEFDFVATGLELNFDFVFASEEYPDYVNSINDSFGFFLSGPGITGIYSGGIAKNIALVPSTNTQISINTVNNGPNNNGVSPQNAAYYFNNSTIGLNPNTSPNPTVQYDGFTKVIRAYSTLQCGGTYHIKLAIGNVSDDLLDSAVFLKNFRIAPLVLLDNLGLDNNPGVCYGEVETIYSGLTQGTTTFVWTRNGVVLPGETGPNLTVTTDGIYALTQTSAGGCVIAADDIIITYRPEIPVTTPSPINLCTSSAPPYIFNIDQTATIIGGLNLGDYIITYYDTNANNEPYYGVPTGIIPDANLSSYAISTSSATVWVRVEEIATGCVTVKSFALNTFSSPNGTISYDASPYCTNLTTPQPVTEHTLTPGGTYSATPAGLIIDPTTGAITPSTSTPGNYIVTYEIAASGVCVLFSTTAPVEIQACTCTVVASSTSETVCVNSALNPITYTVTGGVSGAVISAGALPPGVTGTLSGGAYVVSGVPTATGLYNYTVSINSGLNICTATTAIDVTNAASLTLSSGIATTNQTLCINTAITPITYSISNAGVTGATVTGLPTGVAGSYNNATGIFTISGSPSVAGSYSYTVTTSGGCSSATLAGLINVSPNTSITLTSILATTNQMLCINTGITPITYSIADGGTGASVTGLPTGVTGSYNIATDVFTISGSPSIAGTYNYTVTTTGGCSSASLTGTIVVNPNVTLTLSSGIATTNQTLCINTAITPITYSISNAGVTGATVTGLPTGVSGSYNNATGIFTISGSPSVAGSYSYTVTTSGGCSSATLAGLINVSPNTSITLTSILATTNQMLCINTGITPITYSIADGGTGASVTGLPTGVTGSYNIATDVFTISGSPSVAGTYNYMVTTTGGCSSASFGGTIIVNPNVTLTLSSGIATTNQTLCINTAITPITYSISNAGVTGANVTGLPTGVTGVYNNATGIFTISGSPSAAGSYSYTVTTSGGCSSATLAGLINVSPNTSITLTSIVATTNQMLCINTGITPITYSIADGGTGASITGLPTGVTGSYNAATDVFTITGSPSVAGTYNYTVTTTGGCSSASLGGTIIVNPNVILTLSSAIATTNQTLCINTAITPITYSISNAGVSGATVTGLPTGVSGVYNNATGIFTISGSSSIAGTYTYTVTTTGGCSSISLGGTITINSNATIVLTSPTPTANQTLCINTAITPIVYTIGNGATGATINTAGLPAGVTGVFTGGVFTISGTASSVGAFNYIVTTSGGCSSASLSGVITVNSDVTLLLTSTPITTYQSICLNSPIAPITYAVDHGATGANVVGLPLGITGHFASNIFTITGSTGVTGTFNYVVTTVGGCSSASLNGTIIINPDATIALSSLPGTNIQKLCINQAITPITYLVGNGATGASLTATSVPLGIIGNYNQTTKTFTISGIATESGTFNYVITTSSGCHTASLTGTITVDPLPVVTLPQDGWICVDENGNPISTFDLTTNLNSSQYSFVWSNALGVIPGAAGNSYTATTPGYYSVKVTNTATGCDNSKDATITPSLAPTGVFATASSYFADDAMVSVTVTPPGNYEYQLDNGLFQGWNEFHNISSGEHKITVQDKYGCGTKVTFITILDYPKFFTPNGDGYNDTWNISDLNGQANAKIYIFDRFGKLLKEISPSGTGWDGTFNQINIPSTDYWFKVFYQENGESKEFKSHFSLKR